MTVGWFKVLFFDKFVSNLGVIRHIKRPMCEEMDNRSVRKGYAK